MGMRAVLIYFKHSSIPQVALPRSIFSKYEHINLAKQIPSKSLALVATMTTLDRKENLERFQLGSVNIVELSELDRLCVELSHVSVAFFQGMSPE
jgi:DNA-binding Xre family transcriptional regulator